MITREHLEGAGLLVLALFALAVLFVVAIFVGPWLREQFHIRVTRSKWETTGDCGPFLEAYGASVATARWVGAIWLRGGFRITVSRDCRNDTAGHRRFLHVRDAIATADMETWNRREREREADADAEGPS